MTYQLRNLPVGVYKVELVSWVSHVHKGFISYTFRVPALGGAFCTHTVADDRSHLYLGSMYAVVDQAYRNPYVRSVRFAHFCAKESVTCG